MNTYSICNSKALRTLTIAGVLALAGSHSSIVNAAQGCGHGLHRDMFGRCVMNHGVRYHHAPYYRHYHHCWRNYWGQVRCR